MTDPVTFKIGVMTGVRQVELREIDIPTPGPGQALVAIDATAICTWEQRTYSGQQSNRFPFIGGHEMVGRIVAFGPGYKGSCSEGDRVAIGSASCGSCPQCYQGRDNLCGQHYSGSVAYDDVWGPGGFAQYKLHPSDGLYAVGSAADEVACLTEPLSCAMHALRLSGVSIGQTVVVIGAGVMGLMNVVAARAHGARVIVTEIDAQRLAMAERLGADNLVNSADVDPVEAVLSLTDGVGADVVITAFGSGKANEQGLAMLCHRGTLVLFASAHPETPLELAPNRMHNHEKRVIGVVSSEKLDFWRAAQLIRYGHVDLSPLVQNVYPLEELGDALEEAVQPGTYRVIVKS